MKILVVDDDSSNLSLMTIVLANNGYDVVQAANGEKALMILKSEPVDLIISDIMMPVMDGYHLCHACKSDTDLKNIPFIFCSGTYTDPKDEHLSMEFGADAFIVKPFQNKELLALVARVMETAGKNGAGEASGAPRKDTGEVYKLYSQRLVTKLEEKMLALDKEKMVLEMEVAERRKVEDRLRKSRDFAESLLHAAPGIVLILDTEGRIVRFNPYMERVSGYFLDDVKGRHFQEVFSPEDTGKKFLDPLASGEEDDISKGNISSIITRSGGKKEILWFDSALKDETGKIIGLLAVGREMPERGAVRKGLAVGNGPQAVEHFSQDVIRELHGASDAVLEAVSLLERNMDDAEPKNQLLKKINQGANRIRELTETLSGKNPSQKSR